MLSSITPLGQRSKGRSWRRTVVAFWIGAIVGGATVFGLAGFIGEMLGLDGLSAAWAIAVLIAAGLADLAGWTPPGPHRQVDENWLVGYRDWVVGLGFGLQLGAGYVTYVPTFGVWALPVLAMLVGWPGGILIGLAFGAGRSLLLLTTRSVRSQSSLARLMQRFAGAETGARRLTLAGYAAAAIATGVYVL